MPNVPSSLSGKNSTHIMQILVLYDNTKPSDTELDHALKTAKSVDGKSLRRFFFK
jgi:hypothetical protein